MSRPRKTENAHLPQHVKIKNGAYHWVRDGVSKKLCRVLGTEMSDLYLAIAKHTGANVGATTPATKGDLMLVTELIDRALPVVCGGTERALSPKTVECYRGSAKRLRHGFEVAGTTVAGLKATVVHDLRDTLKSKPSTFNGMLNVLRLMLTWAKKQEIVVVNICDDIEPLPPPKRKRVVHDHEFVAVYERAKAREKVIMDLAFLCGQRISDVLGVRESDLTDGGVVFFPSKTKRHGDGVEIEWNDPLRETIARARALTGGAVRFESAAQYAVAVGGAPMADGFLFPAPTNRKRALPVSTFRQAWMIAVKESGVADFRPHDLRAMAAMATKRRLGAAASQALLCHSTQRQHRDYLRGKEANMVQGPAATPVKV